MCIYILLLFYCGKIYLTKIYYFHHFKCTVQWPLRTFTLCKSLLFQWLPWSYVFEPSKNKIMCYFYCFLNKIMALEHTILFTIILFVLTVVIYFNYVLTTVAFYYYGFIEFILILLTFPTAFHFCQSPMLTPVIFFSI